MVEYRDFKLAIRVRPKRFPSGKYKNSSHSAYGTPFRFLSDISMSAYELDIL